MKNKLRNLKCECRGHRKFFTESIQGFQKRNCFVSLQYNITKEEIRPVWVVSFILLLICSTISYWILMIFSSEYSNSQYKCSELRYLCNLCSTVLATDAQISYLELWTTLRVVQIQNIWIWGKAWFKSVLYYCHLIFKDILSFHKFISLATQQNSHCNAALLW